MFIPFPLGTVVGASALPQRGQAAGVDVFLRTALCLQIFLRHISCHLVEAIRQPGRWSGGHAFHQGRALGSVPHRGEAVTALRRLHAWQAESLSPSPSPGFLRGCERLRDEQMWGMQLRRRGQAWSRATGWSAAGSEGTGFLRQ